jgi:hypothetical protein
MTMSFLESQELLDVSFPYFVMQRREIGTLLRERINNTKYEATGRVSSMSEAYVVQLFHSFTTHPFSGIAVTDAAYPFR